MNIHFNKYEVKLGNKIYIILIPIFKLTKLYVISTDVRSAIVLGNESNLEYFSKLLLVMSQTKNSILYIPSKENRLTDYLQDRWSNKDSGNDLILLHHSLQFNPKDWKEIRYLLSKDRNERKEYLVINNDINIERNLSKYWYRENKDFLDIKEKFNTIFLIGSREIFHNISIDAINVKDEGRDLFERFPGYHAHEHIDYYARRIYDKAFKYYGWSLCLDFYDCELWGR